MYSSHLKTPVVNKIIQGLVKEYNLPYDVVHELILIQFKAMKDIIESGTEGNYAQTLWLTNLCTFRFQPKKLYRVKLMLKKKEERFKKLKEYKRLRDESTQ